MAIARTRFRPTYQNCLDIRGVGDCWIIDQEAQPAVLTLLEDGACETAEEYNMPDTLASPAPEGISVRLDAIFM